MLMGQARLRLLAKPEVWLLAVAGLGLAERLRVAWTSMATLVRKTVSDDAFYYFQIARNIANGHNVTFDGETLTNGFHPLWMALVTPLYLVTDDEQLAIHLALTMSAVLGVVTILFIYLTVHTLTRNPWASLSAAAFYALHPQIIRSSVDGLETSVSSLFLAVTVYLFIRMVRGRLSPTPAGYGLLGLAAGLMILGRAESVAVLAAIVILLLVRERKAGRWWYPGITLATAALLFMPWAIWNLVNFHTIVQVSSVALPYVGYETFRASEGSELLTLVRHGYDITHRTFFNVLPRHYFTPTDRLTIPFLVGVGVLFGFMLGAAPGTERHRALGSLRLLLVPTVAVIAMLVFHSGIRWWVREWYYAPLVLMSAMLAGVVLDYCHSTLHRFGRVLGDSRTREVSVPATPPGWIASLKGFGRFLVPALYGAVALTLALGFTRWGPAQWDLITFASAPRQLESASWLNANTDPEDRIGSFNAGIVGYFTKRTVINLDGVVNNDAHQAIRDRRLMDYVRSMEIRYLVDGNIAWAVAFKRFWGEDPRANFTLVTPIGKPFHSLGVKVTQQVLERTTR